MKQSEHIFPSAIKGEFVFLDQIIEDDARLIYNWRTSNAGLWLNQPDDYSVQTQRDWIVSRPSTEMNWMIMTNDYLVPVGMVGIYDVNWRDGVTNVGRLILDPKYVHKSTPYGLEALKLTYKYAFEDMGMRKISGTICGANDKVVSLQAYLGMTCEGHLKKHTLINGEYQDLRIFSLFKEDSARYFAEIDKKLEKYR